MSLFKAGNNVDTRLATAIAAGDTAFSVLDGGNLPALENGEYTTLTLVADGKMEVIRVTGISGNTITSCQRGYVGAAQDFPINSQVIGTLIGEEFFKVQKELLILPASDESSLLVAGTGKYNVRLPKGGIIDAVSASVLEAPTGSGISIDINKNGASILNPGISIDDGKTDSWSSTTQPGISDRGFAAGDLISVDIDSVGSTTGGKGLKVFLEVRFDF